MKIAIDRDRCIASGVCTLEAPEVFGQDEDGLVVLRLDAPGDELAESAHQAARACPAFVIEIDES
jgi:ferredoxin